MRRSIVKNMLLFKMLWLAVVLLLADFTLAKSRSYSHSFFERNSQSSTPGLDLGPQVDDVIKKILKCNSVPGASVAVVKGDQTWVKGYGMADIKNQRPVTADTLFGVAALTNAFTSALTARAFQLTNQTKMKVTWQTRIRELLGDGVINFPQGLENVTIHDVYTHQTGLRQHILMIFAGFPSSLTRSMFLKQFDQFGERPAWRGKSVFNYWAYSLGADIIEKLLGTSYGTALKRYLLGPLGMHSSRLMWDDVNITSPLMALPYYNYFGNLTQFHSSLFEFKQGKATNNLVTSSRDMAKWMRFMLSNGVTSSGKQLIDGQRMKEMLSTRMLLNANTSLGIGYGWFVSKYRGKMVKYHYGGYHGYTSSVHLLPDQKTGVSVFVNGPGYRQSANQLFRIMTLVADTVLGLSPSVNFTTACLQKSFSGRSANADSGLVSGLVQDADSLGLVERSAPESEGVNRNERESPITEDEWSRILRNINNVRTGSKTSSRSLGSGNSSSANQSSTATRYVGSFVNSFYGEVVITPILFLRNFLLMRFQKLDGFMIAGRNETDYWMVFSGKLISSYYETKFYSRLRFDSFSVADGRYNAVFLHGPGPGYGTTYNEKDVISFTRAGVR